MKLRLICHGMMLFWYKKPSSEGGDDDGYRIFIPQGHHHGRLMHDLRFGVGAGVPKPHPWLRLDTGGVVQPKEFELRFGAAGRRHRSNEVPDPAENLSLYESEDYRAVENPAGIAYTIHVPYPHDEIPIRVATYQRPPYLAGNVVTNLGVAPHRIVGARILTFEIASANIDVQLYDVKQQQLSPVETSPAGSDLTLHLYSEPPHQPGEDEDHTEMINGMLKLLDKNGNALSDFDLKLDELRTPKLDPEGLELPAGLNFRDLLHLWELDALDNPGQSLRARFVDPAECGQGGGC